MYYYKACMKRVCQIICVVMCSGVPAGDIAVLKLAAGERSLQGTVAARQQRLVGAGLLCQCVICVYETISICVDCQQM